MDNYQTLVILSVAFVMSWFGFGVINNIRRGNRVLKWMQSGLPAIGEKTTLRWLGSSAVELMIAKAKPPFRRFELVLLLEPRDVPWLWIWTHSRGRRDMMILRGMLMSAPRLEYDIVASESWSGRSALTDAANRQWAQRTLAGYQFLAPKASSMVSSENAVALLESAKKINPVIWRLAVRREFPQLEVHVPLPNPRTTDASELFDSVRSLGQQMVGK